MDFDSTDALNSFTSDKELSKIRTDAGAILETGIVTIMGQESFTNTKDQ